MKIRQMTFRRVYLGISITEMEAMSGIDRYRIKDIEDDMFFSEIDKKTISKLEDLYGMRWDEMTTEISIPRYAVFDLPSVIENRRIDHGKNLKGLVAHYHSICPPELLKPSFITVWSWVHRMQSPSVKNLPFVSLMLGIPLETVVFNHIYQKAKKLEWC